MAMASPFTLALAKSQVKLLAHSGDFVDVVKEGDIPESGAHAQALRGVKSDRRGGGSDYQRKRDSMLEAQASTLP